MADYRTWTGNEQDESEAEFLMPACKEVGKNHRIFMGLCQRDP